ncbi:MAG: deoxyribose-phosphate aldolase [Bdellovibrionaceae bacterium]|nr:deoxyribose-phosphate aldolase [Bdellovibrionales bacterium]MCB9085507.1 deoxyribose-phosphate aldolase [Pseudobdellovibrionaceae bacterium]
MTPGSSFAQLIDHTLLRPEATWADISRHCNEAITHGFYAVCVNSFWIPNCHELLAGKNVKICATVGFPLGASSTSVKSFEAAWCRDIGADEIDMVINIGAIKSRQTKAVEEDILHVVAASTPAKVKVILETSLLTDLEKKLACEIAKGAGAAFVKTSTGFLGTGASEEDVKLMRSVVGHELGVKASGGIHDLKTLQRMVSAGASRIGTSSGVAIVTGKRVTKGEY